MRSEEESSEIVRLVAAPAGSEPRWIADWIDRFSYRYHLVVAAGRAFSVEEWLSSPLRGSIEEGVGPSHLPTLACPQAAVVGCLPSPSSLTCTERETASQDETGSPCLASICSNLRAAGPLDGSHLVPCVGLMTSTFASV
eukprot:CAMPEP_0194778374 /NCGR_PEP_ID=MMETSP0323_2-20130528/68085_1 /TAXON_ID=2866 ORGANISM="Crypthecodinium cohnii, Strain Seligo" /NCGR_SAMPLE_ID=MMETSP0323_2 /ASSEMBLY_ACC=CAM_ASM_000346 /LENGTH=139 /DNA_ID=CAMNT_0039715559 /DNA_START=71 /DNA_END=486 /DNA_ORIENTATION=+